MFSFEEVIEKYRDINIYNIIQEHRVMQSIFLHFVFLILGCFTLFSMATNEIIKPCT